MTGLQKKNRFVCRFSNYFAYAQVDKANQLSVTAPGPPHILVRIFFRLTQKMDLEGEREGHSRL